MPNESSGRSERPKVEARLNELSAAFERPKKSPSATKNRLPSPTKMPSHFH